jgi:hypothetical protein
MSQVSDIDFGLELDPKWKRHAKRGSIKVIIGNDVSSVSFI